MNASRPSGYNKQQKHQHLSQHPRTKNQVPPPSANTTGKKDGHLSHYPTINRKPGHTSPHLSQHPETSKKRKLGPASQLTAKIKPEPRKHKEQKPTPKHAVQDKCIHQHPIRCHLSAHPTTNRENSTPEPREEEEAKQRVAKRREEAKQRRIAPRDAMKKNRNEDGSHRGRAMRRKEERGRTTRKQTVP